MVVVVVVTTVVCVAGAKENCPSISSVAASCTDCVVGKLVLGCAEYFPSLAGAGEIKPVEVEVEVEVEVSCDVSLVRGEESGEIPEAREGGSIRARDESKCDYSNTKLARRTRTERVFQPRGVEEDVSRPLVAQSYRNMVELFSYVGKL